MATALVSGASGFIGRKLVEGLSVSGYRVIALSRRPLGFSSNVVVHGVDLATGEGLASLPFEDTTLVFHCAGEIRRPELMRRLHRDGTSRLVDALPSDRTIRWIQLSSVGAYGPPRVPGDARVVTEETPERPVGEYEVTKTEADQVVQSAATSGRFGVVMLRPANVVGPGMANVSLPRIIHLVKRRMFAFIGSPGAISNYVHVDDVVSALALCGHHPAASGVFNLSSDCPWESLVQRIALAAGVPAPERRLPERLLRILGGPLGARLGNPLTTARINALTGRTSYPNGRIESALGFTLQKGMPAGIDELVLR